MEIRTATAADARVLSEIARAAKAHWNYPEKWLAIWRPALTIEPDFIAGNEVYAMTGNDRIAGFYGLVIDGEIARLEHLWIAPAFIGTGVGRRLFAHAAERAAASNAKFLNIESDPNAEAFYVKMGAAKIGEIVTHIEGEKRILPLLQIVL